MALRAKLLKECHQGPLSERSYVYEGDVCLICNSLVLKLQEYVKLTDSFISGINAPQHFVLGGGCAPTQGKDASLHEGSENKLLISSHLF